MRKLISIALLCCLLVYIGGYHLVFAVHQYGLKQEMRTYLKQHTDQRFGSYFAFSQKNDKITDADFSWEEQGEEFRYRDELYDVVSIERKGNDVRIAAIKDDKENRLEQQVNQIRKQQHSTPLSGAVQCKFSPAVCMELASFSLQLDFSNNSYRSAYRTPLFSTDEEIQVPPPRCSC